MQKDFHQENNHSSNLNQKRSGILLLNCLPQGEWDRIAEQMMLTFAESGQFSVPRVHCHQNAQKQRWWKIINTLLR